jgi:predicted Ser/Thr protein kinase
MAVSELPPGAIIAGRYQLERELARGGMGCLWIARDPRLGRTVVVKLILSRGSPEAMPEMRGRFEREARAAAKLSNPHVVRIYDYGIDEGRAYMVMELLEGEDLGQRLRARSRLSLGEVGKIVAQTARALEQIHAAGMLHRDLKPGNIFLAESDGEETVKIIDFGIVRATDSGRWTHGPVGTPRYMSPEQFTGLTETDARSDLWSVAVIAYRALTGKHPFEGQMLSELGIQLEEAEFPPPTQIVPELPPATDAFFKRALAHAPGARFESAAELSAAFTKICREGVKSTRILGTKRALATAVSERQALLPPTPPAVALDALPQRQAEPTLTAVAPPEIPAPPPPAVEVAAAPAPLPAAAPPEAAGEPREATGRSAPEPAPPLRARARFARPAVSALPSSTGRPRGVHVGWWWIPAAFAIGAAVAALRSLAATGAIDAEVDAGPSLAVSAADPTATAPPAAVSASAPLPSEAPVRTGPRGAAPVGASHRGPRGARSGDPRSPLLPGR